MRFSDGETEHSFSPDRYGNKKLKEINYDIELVDSHDKIFEALIGSGSCIEHVDEALQQRYVETFASSDNVHFYRIEDQGYARAVEFSTTEGNALAVDAVKAGMNFDTEAYRAGINSIFRHAETMGKDLVLGGNEFFKYRWNQDLDLTREREEVTPADEVFFEDEISQEELNANLSERPYEKGEKWYSLETFFVKNL